ncbi:MAG: hypothetical protein KF871_03715 [Hydrogenophaga sp.]|uniref:hypothetical protein n=1 Tax=Hydrogenophaga sp. TaxID=1904254 RepID=UPI001DCE0A31|nr:hypothetical protein [Hydrogenophaga sp.]MBX3608979.1 hypothetical protein [Hydrogenophaga sp.]
MLSKAFEHISSAISQDAQRIVKLAMKNLSSIERAGFAVVAEHLATREQIAFA